MNYELAKELKDAGFPQKGTSTFVQQGEVYAYIASVSDMAKMKEDGTFELMPYVPSLSELIEACVEIIIEGNDWKNSCQHYFELAINVNHSGSLEEIGKVSEWRASWIRGIDDGFEGQNNYFGSTPEEAVARLWLALNKPLSALEDI